MRRKSHVTNDFVEGHNDFHTVLYFKWTQEEGTRTKWGEKKNKNENIVGLETIYEVFLYYIGANIKFEMHSLVCKAGQTIVYTNRFCLIGQSSNRSELRDAMPNYKSFKWLTMSKYLFWMPHIFKLFKQGPNLT